MRHLNLHPDCLPGPISNITATIEETDEGCRAKFVLMGDINSIKLPDLTLPKRRDFLWKTTCFEIFWQKEGETAYKEFNISPSLEWACYEFETFRKNSKDGLASVAIDRSSKQSELEISCLISSPLSTPARVALNAIVEDLDSNIQFWALAFPPGKAEFHSDVCRQLRLEQRK